MRFRLSIIWILYASSLWSQIPSWQLKVLDPSIEVLAIETDTLGFLWMHDGQTLYRFDGNKAVPRLNLNDESITAIFSHPSRFILGTSNGRILAFNPYNGQTEVIESVNDNQPITGVYYHDSNNYMTLAYGHGVRIVTDGKPLFFDNESGLISNEVYDVAYYNKQYYVATDQGIQFFDCIKGPPLGMTLSTKNGLADLVVTHLLVQNNKLWYTDYDQHIGSIDSLNHVVNHRLPISSKINDLIKSKNSMYIPTDEGLFEFLNGIIVSKFPEKGKVKIKVVQVDEEGNLWLMTGGQELYRGNIYFQKIDSKIDDIRTIAMFQDRMIIGNEQGLYKLENKENVSISSDNITHLATTNQHLFVGTFSKGIKVYDRKMRLISHIDEWSNIKKQSVLHIYANEDDIYVSSLSGVMKFTFENGVFTPRQSLNSIIGISYIYSMVAKDENLYFGTDRNGLIIWDKTQDKSQQISDFETGEKIGSIYAMTLDDEGQLWFTSANEGLGVLKSGMPYRLPNQKNTSDEYTSLATLSNGDLLAIRSSSIDLIDPKKFHIMYFDKEIGLEDDEAFLNIIAQEGNKTRFVNNRNVYSYIPPSVFKIHPEVIIDKIQVNLSEVFEDRPFRQNENNVEFNFTGSWLTNPSKLLYQYRLKGFDLEWRTTKDRSVAFPRLNPGKYEFQLRASENGSFSNEPIAYHSFEIKRYFYNTWWIRTIGLSLLAFVVWQVFKAREKRKKEKQALEKMNIENQLINLKNQLNPHFLFNAFNTLVGLIEEDSERSIVFVEGMTDFYRNILKYGERDLISLAKEKIILEQYIDILKARFNGQLDIHLDISDNIEQYSIPPMTLQLLVENAVKHNVVSSKNPLKIKISQKGGKLIVGNVKRPLMSESKGAKIGLKNINKRFELVNLPSPIIINEDDLFEIILQLKCSV